MMNEHGAGRNGAYGCGTRIESRVAFDGVRFLRPAVQSMREHSQQMRSRDVRHRAVLDGALRQRDPDADFIVLKAGFAKRLVLMPGRGAALVNWFEDRVIPRKGGLARRAAGAQSPERFCGTTICAIRVRTTTVAARTFRAAWFLRRQILWRSNRDFCPRCGPLRSRACASRSSGTRPARTQEFAASQLQESLAYESRQFARRSADFPMNGVLVE